MRNGRWRSSLTAVALATLFLAFAYANYIRWQKTGHPVGLGAVFLEGMTALLFVVRRPPEETSSRSAAWLSAPIGAFAMLLARPVAHPDSGPLWLFEALQLAGFALAIAGLGFLGRSFGVVAALRRIKTSGLYGIVRHPIYSAYLLAYAGYACENTSARNLTLLAVGIVAQIIRIAEEERVLAHDPAYRSYRVHVRYRLIPFVY
jgi:protein-S-isoprenylcysteine O-methyltransferase Ste14